MEITEDDNDLTVKFQGKIFCSYCAKWLIYLSTKNKVEILFNGD